MDLTSLLKGFATEARLNEVRQNALGGCVLEVRSGGKIIIEPTEERDWAYLTGILCPIPEKSDHRLALYDALLKWHGKNLDTQAYCFAMSPVLERVIMSQRLALDGLDQNTFNNAVVAFVQAYLYWLDQIVAGTVAESAVPAENQATDQPTGSSLRL